MAERVRLAIEALEVPRLDGQGTLQVTVPALARRPPAGGRKDELIATADSALYVAKRTGKNRTVHAEPGSANELADTTNLAVGE